MLLGPDVAVSAHAAPAARTPAACASAAHLGERETRGVKADEAVATWPELHGVVEDLRFGKDNDLKVR